MVSEYYDQGLSRVRPKAAKPIYPNKELARYFLLSGKTITK